MSEENQISQAEAKSREKSRAWIEYAATGIALTASLASLWVAIATERANERMVAAASWPFLQIETSNTDAQGHSTLSFSVGNAGVGPAKIEAFEVFWNGKAYANSYQLLSDCCGFKPIGFKPTPEQPTAPPGALITGGIMGTVLRAGETRAFITYSIGGDNAAVWSALDRARRREITYRICYCSVFDECWVSEIGQVSTTQAERVDRCETPKVPYIE